MCGFDVVVDRRRGGGPFGAKHETQPLREHGATIERRMDKNSVRCGQPC